VIDQDQEQRAQPVHWHNSNRALHQEIVRVGPCDETHDEAADDEEDRDPGEVGVPVSGETKIGVIECNRYGSEAPKHLKIVKHCPPSVGPAQSLATRKSRLFQPMCKPWSRIGQHAWEGSFVIYSLIFLPPTAIPARFRQ
jgi:hypothetical protein